MKNLYSKTTAMVFASLLTAAGLNAAVVESFDYTPGLLTATATGTGLTGSWSAVSGGVDIVSGSLSAAGITGYGFATAGNRVSTRADGYAEARVGLGAGNTIDFGSDSTTYFSYLFRVNDTNNQFLLRFLDSSNGLLAYVGANSFNNFLSVQIDANTDSGTSAFTPGSTFLVAGKIETSAAGNDTISASLFTDVTGGEPVSWNAVSTGDSSAIANQLNLYAAASAAGNFEFDEFRMGDSFAAVTIPEPSTFALMGQAGLAAMFFRRRR